MTMKDLPNSTDERDALRAYLQRAEVRLSTMHRVAGVFLNGAGLLFLFPVFFKDAILVTLSALLRGPVVEAQAWLLAAVIASLGLPLYALYLLLKDIALFYFAPHHFDVRRESLTTRWFFPRFVLMGFGVPDDDAPAVRRVMQGVLSTNDDIQHLVVPYQARKRQHLRGLFSDTGGEIVPPSRRDSDASEAVVLANAAIGLSGCEDTTLVREATLAEVMLARHAMNLRRLVLRYTKALLMFIWTTIVGLVVAWQLGAKSAPGTSLSATDLYSAAVVYLVWALVTPLLVMRPIHWIHGLADQNTARHDARRDEELVFFESVVMLTCAATAAAPLIVIIRNVRLEPWGWGLIIVAAGLAIGWLVSGARTLGPRVLGRWT